MYTYFLDDDMDTFLTAVLDGQVERLLAAGVGQLEVSARPQ